MEIDMTNKMKEWCEITREKEILSSFEINDGYQ